MPGLETAKRDTLSLSRPLNSLQGSSIKQASNPIKSKLSTFFLKNLLTMACKPNALILGHSFVRRFQLFLDQGVDHRTVPGLNLSSVDIHFVGIGG